MKFSHWKDDVVIKIFQSSKHIRKGEYFIQQPNGGGFHQSQNSLNRSQDYSNDCFARPMKPISPLKKRPVPTPRSDIFALRQSCEAHSQSKLILINRTILNTSASVVTTGDEAETATTDGESVNRNPSMVSSSFANSLSPIERLIQRYSQIVIDPVRLKLKS